MNSYSLIRLALVSGLLSGIGSIAALAAPKSLPVDPKVGLSLLPPTPPGLDKLGPWKVTISKARQETEVDWLTTILERRYEQAEPVPEKPLATISIKAVDTGGYELPLQMFGMEPLANPRRDFEVQKQPAIKRKSAAGSDRVMILVVGRWLVDVTATGLDAASLNQLLAALPLARLAAVKETPADKLPTKIQLSNIDELNPASNSVRTEFFLTQAEKIAAENAAIAAMEAQRGSGGEGGQSGESKQ